MKKIMFLLLLCLLPLTSAVTLQNQTTLHESDTSGSIIQVWQDTIANVVYVNETLGGIALDELQTFNSTFINKNTTDPSLIQFINMDDVTVYYSNGTIASYTGTNFVLTIEIAADESIILATDVPPIAPSTQIYIKPDYTDTVPHIILGRRLLFTWLRLIF